MPSDYTTRSISFHRIDDADLIAAFDAASEKKQGSQLVRTALRQYLSREKSVAEQLADMAATLAKINAKLKRGVKLTEEEQAESDRASAAIDSLLGRE